MKTVSFRTFGCRLNAYDTESIRALLGRNGWSTISLKAEADVYIVNTCSVTHQADARARKAIRRLKSEHPNSSIVVTGCYAQRAPQEIANIPGVSLIVGAADRANIPEALDRISGDSLEIAVSPIENAREFLEVPITEMMEKSRALVKVQEGCNQACTFCIVPQTRGRSRSRRPEFVLGQIEKLVESGYSEIVLTGVHIGSYGIDLRDNKTDLISLISHILDIPGLARFRLSSIEPSSVSDALIELMASESKFARHFHIPFQSGSNNILDSMKRGYTRDEFVKLIAKIEKLIPSCGIGTDVIAGFPGESDDDFQETFDVITDLPITYLHPFTYSMRPGSNAQVLGDTVSGDVKKRRTRSLKRLSQEKNLAFKKQHLGTIVDVLFEGDTRNGHCCTGYTDNFLRVSVDEEQASRKIVACQVSGLNDLGLTGYPASSGDLLG